MSQTVIEPEISQSNVGTGRWMVIIYNNDSNSMDEVVEVLMRATNCTDEEAFIEMWEAHTYGKAAVHFASKVECEEAAQIIASVGIKTEVALEWND